MNEEPEAEPISEEPSMEDAPVKETKPGDPQNKKQLLIICGAAAAITLLIAAVCLFFLFGSGKAAQKRPRLLW